MSPALFADSAYWPTRFSWYQRAIGFTDGVWLPKRRRSAMSRAARASVVIGPLSHI
jgi:hypothetical protein